MPNTRQILYESVKSTGRFPRWWILALAQAMSLYIAGDLSQPSRLLKPFSIFWIILAIFVMVPASSFLWLEIQAQKTKFYGQLPIKVFFRQCLPAGAVVFCSFALILGIKFLYGEWLFSALISSLISATATLALLYIILCGQTFGKALYLALDTWNKKISLAAMVAFVLIVSHGVSYALVHGILGSLRKMTGFSVYSHSATIWILFLGLLFLTALISAFLNSFLVLLFLEIIGRKKDPETEKVVMEKLLSPEASH